MTRTAFQTKCRKRVTVNDCRNKPPIHANQYGKESVFSDTPSIEYFAWEGRIHYGENAMDSYTGYNPDTQLATGIFIDAHVLKNELKPGLSKDRNDNMIPDYTVLSHIDAMFHEAYHVKETNKTAQCSGSLGEDLACARIACMKNRNFYLNDHYSEVAFEVDAELHSILRTRSFLDNSAWFKDLTSEIKNQAMVDFVNRRMTESDYPLNRIKNETQYTDWQEILDDIKGSPEKNILPAYDRIQNSRINGTMTYDILWLDPTCTDMIAPVFIHCPDLTQKLHDVPTIRDECRIMASITCEIFPNLQSKFHALDNVDLSMKTVCGRTFAYEEEYVKNEVIQRYENLNDTSDIISARKLPYLETENIDKNFCEKTLVD